MEDPVITDNTTMTGAEKRHDRSGETTFDTAVLCACTDLQEESAASGPTSSQRFRVRGMETAVQEVWTASSGETLWNAPSPLAVDEISRVEAVGPSVEKKRGKVCEEQSGNEESERQCAKRLRFSEQDRRLRCLETRTPQTWCRRAADKVTSQRNRRSTSAGRRTWPQQG